MNSALAWAVHRRVGPPKGQDERMPILNAPEWLQRADTICKTRTMQTMDFQWKRRNGVRRGGRSEAGFMSANTLMMVAHLSDALRKWRRPHVSMKQTVVPTSIDNADSGRVYTVNVREPVMQSCLFVKTPLCRPHSAPTS